MKNLAEEGFDVTGFERSSSIGGVWSYEDTPTKTTALKSTYANGSKYKICFTDFPYSAVVRLTADLLVHLRLDTPAFPHASQVHQYLKDYAAHFNLYGSVHTNIDILAITRNEEDVCWDLRLRKNTSVAAEVVKQFDRVVIATGINQIPVIPEIDGIEKFRGTVIHSQQFKNPDAFTGQRVLVVGLNNSAGDTATSLLGHAAKIYLSHRGGTILLKRWNKNKPVDHDISWTRLQIMQKYMDYVPSLYNWSVLQLQNKLCPVLPEWKLNDNLPPFTQRLPLINDSLVPAMHEGKIIPVANLATILDAHTVRLADGTTIPDLDAIIFCTGYRPDFSILGAYEAQFTRPYRGHVPDDQGSSSSPAKQLPRLYQNIFSLEYPDSLAYICGVGFQMPVFHVYDLATMALAQVWKGAAQLPSGETMRAQAERHYEWLLERERWGNGNTNGNDNGTVRRSVHTDLVQAPEWYRWVNETAGTGVYEKLGYGAEGWRFWWWEREFCGTLMHGMFSPHTYRLFEGGRRKRWDGARDEILRVVREIEEMGRDGAGDGIGGKME
ncbi:flavin-containing monooxygenase [Aspergillus mulundensis]|uniref:Dimethylaniline monooxygenase n=1 Tax=Aspergillus mulundensis TaxID=1810919 RepID=A0A3D8QRS8_9EURO|nr:hypothetical protein DSM5745_09930 [Aspergillus mulundensis]RDW64519.1 hypothetical protein DSM5745_09930 [Aspergillus mulundensis]